MIMNEKIQVEEVNSTAERTRQQTEIKNYEDGMMDEKVGELEGRGEEYGVDMENEEEVEQNRNFGDRSDREK